MAPLDRRMDAAAMLRLDRDTAYRVVVVPASAELRTTPSTLIYTVVGPVRAFVPRFPATPQLGDAQLPAGAGSRTGVGLAMEPGVLHRSWASALLALRLTSDGQPRQLADDLGGLLVLAEAADSSAYQTPDLTALTRLVTQHPKALRLLESLATGKASLRAIHQARIKLNNVRIPKANLLPGARTFKDTSEVLVATRLGVAWSALGQLSCSATLVTGWGARRRWSAHCSSWASRPSPSDCCPTPA
ncbi:hypothetical protein [Arthrobacter sp. ISL-69]|uniref:hypothetical protein n=1 Tax=Arthrobacter sp. ISL-69 TaxID=2819113 RepID=UPI0037BF5244